MNYDRRMVEILLSAMWDEQIAYSGLKRDHVPDPTMPKAKQNPAHGFTVAAMLGDIGRAWSLAPIPTKERRVLLLHHGMDMTQREAAHVLKVPPSTVQARAERGVGRIVAWLNGKRFNEKTHVIEDDVQVTDKEDE